MEVGYQPAPAWMKRWALPTLQYPIMKKDRQRRLSQLAETPVPTKEKEEGARKRPLWETLNIEFTAGLLSFEFGSTAAEH